MSYNYIYTINNNSSPSKDYKTIDECYAAQSAFISSDIIKKSNLPAQIQGCADYNSNDDGEQSIIYNFNANTGVIDNVNNLDTSNGKPITKINNNSPQYTLLEPIAGIGSSTNVDSNSFANYLQNSFNVIFGVIIVLAVFRIMYGGALFLTSDVVIGKMKGKDIIINSLRGIFLALITWSIMYWINPEMLDNRVGGVLTDSGNLIKDKIIEKINNINNTPYSNNITAQQLLANILKDEDNVRNQLKSNNIVTNHEACQSVGAKGCTDVGMISSSVINKIINLKVACACDVTITGGSEWWAHGKGVIDPQLNRSNHVPGKNAKQGIDLNLSDSLKSFIQKSGVSLGQDDYCYAKYEYAGGLYCDEKNSARHFHVDY